jgi:hypothetical protein
MSSSRIARLNHVRGLIQFSLSNLTLSLYPVSHRHGPALSDGTASINYFNYPTTAQMASEAIKMVVANFTPIWAQQDPAEGNIY